MGWRWREVGRSRAFARSTCMRCGRYPCSILALGPDHPRALAWLWQHWGTTQALRHVVVLDEAAGDQEADRGRAGGAAARLLGGGLDAVAGAGGGGSRLAGAALRDPAALRPGGMTDTIERAVESRQPDAVDWEQPPRVLRRESEAPVLSVDGFEGPLDWLLELVRTQRLDLSRLSIVALIKAFATALEQALQLGSVAGQDSLVPVTLGRLAGDGGNADPAARATDPADQRAGGAGRHP